MSIWYSVEASDLDCRMAVFRNRITIGDDGKFVCRYSADEQADVFIDGKWVDTGAERGDRLWWYYRDLELDLVPGEHLITVRLLMFGRNLSAAAQETIRYGIFFESASLSGKWEYSIAENCSFNKSEPDWGWFPTITAEENFNYTAIDGIGGVWKDAVAFEDTRVLHAPDVPHWVCREENNYRVIEEATRKLIVFDNYVRCRCEYRFSGDGEVRLLWNEAPFTPEKKKLHREAWEGCFLPGKPAVLRFKDGVRWVDYHYRTGRCLQIECTGNVKIEEMRFVSVKYPYEKMWQAKCSSPQVEQVLDMAWNTLEYCSFESFMDCPYYEQMQYVGDTRIESLVSYVTERNPALPLKGVRELGRSTDLYGVTLSRSPSWQEQMIPSFSLVWILVLEDFITWQGFDAVADELDHARANLKFYEQHLDADGLPDFTGWDRISGWDGETGWNFLDWHDSLFRGIPKGNCPVSVLYVLALEAMARLEKRAGNDTDMLLEKAKRAAQKILDRYYDSDQNILMDDDEGKFISEHPQIFATLSDSMPDCKLELPDAMPAGIYFSHYYLEAAYRTRNVRAFWKRFGNWFQVLDEGLKTFPEEFTHPRSDCHAWSSHVLYHYFASILGVRPRDVQKKEWNIDPLFVDLDFAGGTLTHATGDIFVRWEKVKGAIQVEYRLPEGFTAWHNGKKLTETQGTFLV